MNKGYGKGFILFKLRTRWNNIKNNNVKVCRFYDKNGEMLCEASDLR